jgi:hypothetical protein
MARFAAPSGTLLALGAVWMACESAPPPNAEEEAGAPVAEDLAPLPLDVLVGNRAFDDLQELVQRAGDAAAQQAFVAEQLKPTGLSVQTVTTPAAAEGKPTLQHVVAEERGASPDLFLLVAPLAPGGGEDAYSGSALLLELARVLSTRSLPYSTRLVWIGGAPADGGAAAYAADLASRGEITRVRLLVAFERVCDGDLRIARDLGSHRVHREEFFDAAARTGHENVFRRDASFESVDGVHLPFRSAGVRGVVAVAPSVRPESASTPRSCNARSLAAVGDVSLDAIDAIGRRLAKIDRFSRAPIAGLEDPNSVSAAPPSSAPLPEGGVAGASAP